MTSTFADRVDGVSTTTAIKPPVRAATTGNITLAGEQAIDGVSIVSGDRVLVKDQSNQIENGIWVAALGPWARAVDCNGARDLKTGTIVRVNSGSTNGASSWYVTTTSDLIIPGVTEITFARDPFTAVGEGSTLVTGTLSTVARPLSDRADDWLNIKDFGTSANWVAAFQAAIDATTNSGVQVIHVPRGSYTGDFSALDAGARKLCWVEQSGVTYSVAPPPGNRMNASYSGDVASPAAKPWFVGQYGFQFSPAGTSGESPCIRVIRDVDYTSGTATNPCAASFKTIINSADNGTKENVILAECDDYATNTGSGFSRTALMAVARRKDVNKNNEIAANIFALDDTAVKSSTTGGSLVACEFGIFASGPDNAANGLRFGLDIISFEQATSADGATTCNAAIRIRNAGSAFSAASTWTYGVKVIGDYSNGGINHPFASFGSPDTILYSNTDNVALIIQGTTLNTGTIGQHQYKAEDSAAATVTYTQIQSSIIANTAGAASGRFDIATRRAGTLTTEASCAGGMTVGAPTGSYKGVGSINVAADIYKNNTAYTNPKWVLQHYYTGAVDEEGPHAPPAPYTGLMSISDAEQFAMANHELPLMTMVADKGLFSGSDLLLASVESSYLYLFDINRRLKAIEDLLEV